MTEVHATARFAIHDGKFDEFAAIASKCVEVVREQDTRTLRYDWFYDRDHSECVVLETYADSDAAVNINLSNSSASGGHAQGDTFTGFSGVIGSGFDDALRGAVGVASTLVGGGGNDFLFGLGGTNSISGGAGNDNIAILINAHDEPAHMRLSHRHEHRDWRVAFCSALPDVEFEDDDIVLVPDHAIALLTAG